MADEERLPLGERIRRLRIQRGLQAVDLANALGVTKHMVSRWETQKAKVPAELLPQIAEALNLSLDELFGRPAPPPQIERTPVALSYEGMATKGLTPEERRQVELLFLRLAMREMRRGEGGD